MTEHKIVFILFLFVATAITPFMEKGRPRIYYFKVYAAGFFAILFTCCSHF